MSGRHFFLLAFFLFGCMPMIQAQFGMRAKYNASDVPGWDRIVIDKFGLPQELFSTGWELGLDYWIRLKNYRVEFYPEVAYSQSESSGNNDFVDRYQWKSFHFNLNTHIYFLDLLGDCDCPTFSKDGTALTKGLFFMASPGLGYTNNTLDLQSIDVAPASSKNLYWKIGAGIGFDAGLSDLITITPHFLFNYAPSVEWDNFESDQDLDDWLSGPANTSLKQVQFGLRIGFRPDYKK